MGVAVGAYGFNGNGNGGSAGLLWVYRLCITALLGLVSWVGIQMWSGLSTLETRLRAIELQNAQVAGNRFTSNDWMIAKGALDVTFAAQEKRLYKAESQIDGVKGALGRIERKLGTR